MLHSLIAQASGIKRPNSSVYTKADFLGAYPQFNELLPTAMMDAYVQLGNDCVSDVLFGKVWQVAIGLFIAHFCTLYLQSMRGAGAEVDDVLAAAASAGVVTSESADGVSHSMDNSALNTDLNGWAAFKLTTFGVQFATLAKVRSHGGMYVW